MHSDFRPDNLMFGIDDDGRPTVAAVDWQGFGHGCALSDVSFIIGNALTADDRRANEERIVRGYHDSARRGRRRRLLLRRVLGRVRPLAALGAHDDDLRRDVRGPLRAWRRDVRDHGRPPRSPDPRPRRRLDCSTRSFWRGEPRYARVATPKRRQPTGSWARSMRARTSVMAACTSSMRPFTSSASAGTPQLREHVGQVLLDAARARTRWGHPPRARRCARRCSRGRRDRCSGSAARARSSRSAGARARRRRRSTWSVAPPSSNGMPAATSPCVGLLDDRVGQPPRLDDELDRARRRRGCSAPPPSGWASGRSGCRGGTASPGGRWPWSAPRAAVHGRT